MIETDSLGVRYDGRRALRGVSLRIPDRAITAIVGPSGCGKTSFLHCLNRLTDLVPGCAVEGRVRMDGLDVLSPTTDVVALRRRVGMIFQTPAPLPFTIRKNLDLPLREHRIPDREAAAERALRDVGLWEEVKDRLDAPASRLSGGQQQRLCLARALALGPEVVLFDEPCGALDPISSGTVEDLIVRLKGRYTVAVVTHNLAQARRIADQVAVFWTDADGGRLAEAGPAAKIFESPDDPLTAAYVRGARG